MPMSSKTLDVITKIFSLINVENRTNTILLEQYAIQYVLDINAAFRFSILKLDLTPKACPKPTIFQKKRIKSLA